MNRRNRDLSVRSAPPNHRMKERVVTKRVALAVDGQFDDAVNESPPHTTSPPPTWIDTTTTTTTSPPPSNPVDQVRPTQNNTVPVVSHTTNTNTTTTTNVPPPPHPWWSFGPTTILVLHHSSVIPPVMALSAAPTAVLPQHLPPPRPQSLYHNQGQVWPRTAPPNTHVALPHSHHHLSPPPHHHHVPIAATPPTAPRPVRPTYLPIAPRPAALGGDGTVLPATTNTTATTHHKKRRWSTKKLPTAREKLCHSSQQHGGDDIGTVSSYGTKLVDRIIHPPSRNDHQSRPFHNLLSHHPNAALIPHSGGVRVSERIIPLMKLVPRDEQCACPVSVRHNMRPADVLLGRGGTSNRNQGNLYFRQLISYYRCFYHVLPKGSKGQLSRNICNYVRLSGGRFLEKRRRHDKYWYECGDARALAKCSQALRETNCVSTGSTHGDSGHTSTNEEEEEDDDDYDENDDDDNDDNDDDDSSGETPNAKKMR